MSVEDYYERNTRWFLALGTSGDAGAIHREVWAPGVRTVAEAVDQAHVLVEASIAEVTPTDRPPTVIDLGCGVGGSLCRLLQRGPASQGQGIGLTISTTQATLATERAERLGVAERARFLQGDFNAPPGLPAADVAYAIEAFVHGSDPAAFFAAAAGLLQPHGHLVLVDDFLDPSRGEAAASTVRAFEAGWQLGSLDTVPATVAHAEAAGLTLVQDTDLTDQLNLWRPRDWAVAAAVTGLGWLPIRHPYWGSLTGGHALQVGLSRRWIRYRHLVFARR
ncbi:MAG: class I SAM-dependent methyltransferase [Myxococcales bacterium]|nr:class I SAM-dependent methyltransferase [Myxococcales bacterium]